MSGTDDIAGVPTPVLSVLNAGKLRINGAELEAAWTPFDNLLLDAQLGYLDAEYKDFDDVRFTTCCAGSRAFQTPAFAPKWTIRLGAQYGFDIGTIGSLTLGAQTRHKSRTALAVDNTLVGAGSGAGAGTTTEVDGLFQKGYWLHDARIVFETADKHWALGLLRQQSGRPRLQDRRPGILVGRQYPDGLLRRPAHRLAAADRALLTRGRRAEHMADPAAISWRSFDGLDLFARDYAGGRGPRPAAGRLPSRA